MTQYNDLLWILDGFIIGIIAAFLPALMGYAVYSSINNRTLSYIAGVSTLILSWYFTVLLLN